jgi:hypothetical protein
MGHSREPEHTPGSPEAIAKGCTCDPVINSGGRGTLSASGQVAFIPDNSCPLHGLALVKRLLRDEDAVLPPGLWALKTRSWRRPR